MLNEKRYYQIVAVDNDYMLSEPSPVVEVERPDVFPPAPALIGDYKVLPEGIRITILPSSSRDVVRHELHRSSASQAMERIASFTRIPESYIDTTVLAETEYTYRIIAVDDKGLASHSVKDLVITSMHASHGAPVLSYELSGDQLKLMIDQAHGAAAYGIYQSINGKQYQQVERIESNLAVATIKPGINYQYRVRAITSDGRPAPFSNEITVQLPTQ
jgi:fibronectin type 3 domain-containing protein